MCFPSGGWKTTIKFLVRTLFLTCRWLSSCSVVELERERTLSPVSSYAATNPSRGPHSHDLITSQCAFSRYIMLGLGFNLWILVGKDIQSIEFTSCSPKYVFFSHAKYIPSTPAAPEVAVKYGNCGTVSGPLDCEPFSRSHGDVASGNLWGHGCAF